MRKKNKSWAPPKAYLFDLVELLKESLVGSAHTAIIVCVSQAPANAKQSAIALEFGSLFSQLTIDKLRQMPSIPAEKVACDAKSVLARNEAANSTKGKYQSMRQALSRQANIQLAVLELLKESTSSP